MYLCGPSKHSCQPFCGPEGRHDCSDSVLSLETTHWLRCLCPVHSVVLSYHSTPLLFISIAATRARSSIVCFCFVFVFPLTLCARSSIFCFCVCFSCVFQRCARVWRGFVGSLRHWRGYCPPLPPPPPLGNWAFPPFVYRTFALLTTQ